MEGINTKGRTFLMAERLYTLGKTSYSTIELQDRQHTHFTQLKHEYLIP